MPSAIDVLEPFRAAVADFGVVAYKDGSAVPAAPNALFDTRTAFQRQTGIEVAHGSHVVSVEIDALGTLALDDRLIVDGAAYIYRGPADGDRRVQHLQVVEEAV